MTEKNKTHGFSIRLLKEDSNNISIKSLLKIGNVEIVDSSTLPTKEKIKYIEDYNKIYHYKIADKYDAYLKKTFSPNTWWSNFLNLDTKLDSPCYYFIMLIPVFQNGKERKLVYTFGYGHTILNEEHIEYNFGLKVALNSIDPEKLKSADKFAPSNQTKQTRTQLSIGSSLYGLGFNEFEEIIKKLSGLCKNEYKDIFTSITGSDSLKINSKFKLEQIEEFSKKIIELYLSNEYTKHPQLSNVDKISKVKDPIKINQLDKKLVDNFNQKDSNIFLTNYEMIDYEDYEYYGFSGFASKNIFNDLDIDQLYNELAQKNISIENLKEYQVKIYKNEDDTNPKHWKLYNCIVTDAILDKRHYILSLGTWYEVDKTFIEHVETTINSLEIKSNNLFNDYDASIYNKLDESDSNKSNGEIIDPKLKGEKRYNKAMAEKNKFIMLDQKMIHINGAPYEACDIFDKNTNTFYHVKRKHSGSSELSHLFNQGINSEKMASVNINNQYSTQFKKYTNCDLQEDRKVRYVIITPPNSKNELTMPIFSKISLYNTINELRAMKCFDVQYMFVKEINIKKKVKKRNKKIIKKIEEN